MEVNINDLSQLVSVENRYTMIQKGKHYKFLFIDYFTPRIKKSNNRNNPCYYNTFSIISREDYKELALQKGDSSEIDVSFRSWQLGISKYLKNPDMFDLRKLFTQGNGKYAEIYIEFSRDSKTTYIHDMRLLKLCEQGEQLKPLI